MKYTIKKEDKFQYVDEGEGEVLLLLHGLFGALSNWSGIVDHFKTKMRVVIPMMPIYDMPLREAGIEGLNEFIQEFVSFKKLNNLHLIGNSLGGHVGLKFTLLNQHLVKSLTLTGSSGLFENGMGGSYPKRGNYEYIKERVEYTFFDPNVASKELIDEVFDITKSIPKCLRIIAIAKSAQRNNMNTEIGVIKVPTLLIWGLNDTITPPSVGHEFNKLISGSELRFIDQCGHAPMMEHPVEFNKYYEDFYVKHFGNN